jgi:hypothetical protein
VKNNRPYLLIVLFYLFNGSPAFCQPDQRQFEGYFVVNRKIVPLVMKLHFNSDTLSGLYYYSEIGKDISLNGRSKGNVITLNEMYDAVPTGTFKGVYYRKADSISGMWMRKKDRKQFHFHLERTEWVDYKIISRNTGKKDGDWGWEWIEMRDNPDTLVQNRFNSLEENSSEAPGEEWGPGYDGDSTLYTFAKMTSTSLAAPGFISFEVFHSDYLGGMGGNNSIAHYHFNFAKQDFLRLGDLLRKDTAADAVLDDWIEKEIRRRGDWENWSEDYLSKYGPEESPDGDFYFASDGVYFFFPRPGAITNILGIEDVRIPYEKMITIMDPGTDEYRWMKRKLGKK